MLLYPIEMVCDNRLVLHAMSHVIPNAVGDRYVAQGESAPVRRPVPLKMGFESTHVGLDLRLEIVIRPHGVERHELPGGQVWRAIGLCCLPILLKRTMHVQKSAIDVPPEKVVGTI